MNGPISSYRAASLSYVENVELITQSHSFHDKTAFGGQLFSWMDSAAAISAMKHSGLKAVTASVDALSFLKPVIIGNLVHVQARVIATYRTSCHVRGIVYSHKHRRENPEESQVLIAMGFFRMVSVDDNGRPQPMPGLELLTEDDERLQRLGHEIKGHSESLRMALKGYQI